MFKKKEKERERKRKKKGKGKPGIRRNGRITETRTKYKI